MSPTPDRHPGTLEEERLRLTYDEGKTADVPGDVVFDGTSFSMRDATGAFNPRLAGTLWKVDGGDLAPLNDGRGVILTHSDGVQKALIKRNGGNLEITVYGTDAQALYKNTRAEVTQLGGNDDSVYFRIQNSDDDVCAEVYGDKSARFYGPLTQGNAGSLASAPDSFAQGTDNSAEGDASHAQGVASRATNHTQHAWAGGCLAEAGDAQASHVVLRGATPGVAVGEEIELHFGAAGTDRLGLPPRAWNILIEAVASSGDDRMCIKQMLLAKSWIGPLFRAGFSVSAFGMQEKLYTEDATSWTLRVAAIPFPTNQTRMGVLFCTGASQAAVNVVCNIRMIEINEPGH
jgi:hypothetical protein